MRAAARAPLRAPRARAAQLPPHCLQHRNPPLRREANTTTSPPSNAIPSLSHNPKPHHPHPTLPHTTPNVNLLNPLVVPHHSRMSNLRKDVTPRPTSRHRHYNNRQSTATAPHKARSSARSTRQGHFLRNQLRASPFRHTHSSHHHRKCLRPGSRRAATTAAIQRRRQPNPPSRAARRRQSRHSLRSAARVRPQGTHLKCSRRASTRPLSQQLPQGHRPHHHQRTKLTHKTNKQTNKNTHNKRIRIYSSFAIFFFTSFALFFLFVLVPHANTTLCILTIALFLLLIRTISISPTTSFLQLSITITLALLLVHTISIPPTLLPLAFHHLRRLTANVSTLVLVFHHVRLITDHVNTLVITLHLLCRTVPVLLPSSHNSRQLANT